MWKNKVRNPMFGRIRSEFQCLEGLGQTSNVWKGKERIEMLGRIGPEIQYFEG